MDNEEMQGVELDPMLEKLLDTKLYKDKVEILYDLRDRLTDEMINIICITHDIELKSTDLDDRYHELRDYMMTMKKYESDRLR
ncbi:MAG: hypothetical protein IKS87_00380 [Lachnospiraceae bacterium]|nr:hypothetical protein [Lachnospiraceae bacterium]